MAAPLAIPAAAQAIGKAVSQDLVVIGGQWFHRHVIGKGKNKHEILTPINYEVHVNPVSIGLGGLAIAAAAGIGWFVWNGLEIHSGLGNKTQILPGLKDSDRFSGKSFAEGLGIETADHKAQCKATLSEFLQAKRDGDLRTARALWDYNAGPRDAGDPLAPGPCRWTKFYRRP